MWKEKMCGCIRHLYIVIHNRKESWRKQLKGCKFTDSGSASSFVELNSLADSESVCEAGHETAPFCSSELKSYVGACALFTLPNNRDASAPYEFTPQRMIHSLSAIWSPSLQLQQVFGRFTAYDCVYFDILFLFSPWFSSSPFIVECPAW
jgi:hypothetical protein